MPIFGTVDKNFTYACSLSVVSIDKLGNKRLESCAMKDRFFSFDYPFPCLDNLPAIRHDQIQIVATGGYESE